MKKDIKKKDYRISRKDASQILGVSVRTIDRYVKLKKISAKTEENHILLDFSELKQIKDQKVSEKRPERYFRRNMGEKVGTIRKQNQENNLVKTEILRGNLENEKTEIHPNQKESILSFKKIYEELKEEIKEKQERLEMANYRVGQLEAQIRNSVPMLEYHRENYKREKKEEEMKGELRESKEVIVRLSGKLRYIKLSKRLYITILLVVLALQPLWILFFNSLE